MLDDDLGSFCPNQGSRPMAEEKQEPDLAKINESIKKMKEAWRIGRKHRKNWGERLGYGSKEQVFGDNDTIAAQNRRNLKIAKTLTWKELLEICRLCKEHKVIWGLTYLYELCRLESPELRDDVVRIATEEGWSQRELVAEIRRRRGTSTKGTVGGRPRDVDMADERLILEEIHRLCIRWTRFFDQLQTAQERGWSKGLGKLTPKIKEYVTSVTKNVDDLRKRADKRISFLNKPRKKGGD